MTNVMTNRNLYGMNRVSLFIVFSFLLFVSQVQAQSKGDAKGEILTQDLLVSIPSDFDRHDYKKVVRLYRDYVSNHPEKYIPMVVRILYSQSLANLGEVEDSIVSLKNLLSDLPPQFDPMKLQYDLANLLFLQNRLDEARSAYQKVMILGENSRQVQAKSKERLAWIRAKEEGGRGKDLISLRLSDIETLLEIGEIPDGADIFLKQVIQDQKGPESPSVKKAKKLLTRIQEIRTERAKALLDEARRLYDEEKKFTEVREILNQILASYSDVVELPSVEALMKAVSNK
jgi:tetratricopeptide (TPR) repeat protein